MQRARYVVEPQVFVRHTPERSFIGPGTIRLENGDILMAAPWGRPPTNFEQLAARFPVPMLYRSRDGGRTWHEQGRMKMEWKLPGMMSDGGITFLRLQDAHPADSASSPQANSGQGRLACLAHRHVQGLHGGGVPAFSTSVDNGANWSPARLLIGEDSVHYVMNDRMIQLRSGRLIVPTSHPGGVYGYEGDAVVARCFISDDSGDHWRLSPADGITRLAGDLRGMAEPCISAAIPIPFLTLFPLLKFAVYNFLFVYQSESVAPASRHSWSDVEVTVIATPSLPSPSALKIGEVSPALIAHFL